MNVLRINATGAQVGIEMYGTETSINTAKEIIIELVISCTTASIQIPQAKK